ncbi:MAG: hypothetical protein IPM02_21730 [Betaproteobacteria bacterium]|nr:hypothetical protein [Betaproteobacteria bacterium]
MARSSSPAPASGGRPTRSSRAWEPDGAADATFGTNGVVLLSPPPGSSWMTPIQLETHADGSLLVVGILYNGFVLARIGASGMLDSGFGSGGMLVVQDTAAFHGNAEAGAIRVATQADGRILVITDASANGIFALRFRRFLAQGTPDTSFGTYGERLLGNLPPDFAFGTSSLAVAEATGGFTLAARATFQGGTYLLLRVTGDGASTPASAAPASSPATTWAIRAMRRRNWRARRPTATC